MTGPQVIDIAALLEPISEEAAAGTDSRGDKQSDSLYYRVKDARNAARSEERSAIETGAATPEEWNTVVSTSIELLTTASKDLEVAAWLVEGLIKGLVGRPRPEIVPHLTEAGGASFPSGHAFNSAVVYIAIALAFATLSARESVRLTIICIAIVLSLAIAWTRVWLGVHFPSDVTAGWLGGAGWAFLASALLQRPAEAAAESKTAEKLDPTVH